MVIILRKISILILLFTFIFPGAVQASIQVKTYEPVNNNFVAGLVFGPIRMGERVPTVQEVYKEVYFLEQNQPLLTTVNWTIYTVDRYCYVPQTQSNISGIARLSQQEIYIFSQKFYKYNTVEQTVDHELGHLFRAEFITYLELMENFNNVGSDFASISSSPDELFTDIFSRKYGSVKEWSQEQVIFEKRLERIMPQIYLRYYEKNPDEGQKEIDRADRVRTKKMIKGDPRGASRAHIWADQVREAIKIKQKEAS